MGGGRLVLDGVAGVALYTWPKPFLCVPGRSRRFMPHPAHRARWPRVCRCGAGASQAQRDANRNGRLFDRLGVRCTHAEETQASLIFLNMSVASSLPPFLSCKTRVSRWSRCHHVAMGIDQPTPCSARERLPSTDRHPKAGRPRQSQS